MSNSETIRIRRGPREKRVFLNGLPMTSGQKGAYSSWAAMRQRVLGVNSLDFKNYGGRGISICKTWQTFEGFYADMGDRPESLTLDRIDVNGNYEPGNCRWATKKEQRANVRPHKYSGH